MKKICFYINTDKIPIDLDFTDLNKGNPGYGATEYLFFLITSQLMMKYSDLIHVTLLTTTQINLPFHIRHAVTCSDLSALEYCTIRGIDILVFRPTTNIQFYDCLRKTNLKAISWAHNKISYELAELLNNSDKVVRNICVGYNQALDIVGHSLFKKTDVIRNPALNNLVKREISDPVITYMGHISEDRGLHILLESWKEIKKRVKDAKLYIIGSARLYDRDHSVGANGITDEIYEKKIQQYLFSEDGKKDDSIFFLGILGQEKSKVFSTTMVGVINPYGYESLGVSGLEMAAAGVPIVTINKHGQSEVVKHGFTGFLFNRRNEFIHFIIKLLEDRPLNEQLGHNARIWVNNSFSFDNVVETWKDLLSQDFYYNNKPNHSFLKEVKLSPVKSFDLLMNNLSTPLIQMPTIFKFKGKYTGLIKKVKSIIFLK